MAKASQSATRSPGKGVEGMSEIVHHGINQICTCQDAIDWSRPSDAFMRSVRRVALKIRGWSERSRQRRALLELDDHHLKDIGLSRTEVMAEARKPFWM
jgi:uncharacterized protein YjiS (DUF1127 family)